MCIITKLFLLHLNDAVFIRFFETDSIIKNFMMHAIAVACFFLFEFFAACKGKSLSFMVA